MFVVRNETICQTNHTKYLSSSFFLVFLNDLNKYQHFLCGQLSNYVLNIQNSSTFVLPLNLIVFYRPNTFTVLQRTRTKSKRDKMCFSFFYSNFLKSNRHTHRRNHSIHGYTVISVSLWTGSSICFDENHYNFCWATLKISLSRMLMPNQALDRNAKIDGQI